MYGPQPIDVIFPEKNERKPVKAYTTPLGDLVQGNARNKLGVGWFFLPTNDCMKSFGERGEAVRWLMAKLDKEMPEWVINELGKVRE